MASRASASSTPASSNITRPGLTTATQPSGLPLPEPMRVSAGFLVKGLSGKTFIQTFPPRLILRVIAIRAASIWRLVSQPASSALRPYSPNSTRCWPRDIPGLRPRCWRRNLTRFGDSITPPSLPRDWGLASRASAADPSAQVGTAATATARAAATASAAAPAAATAATATAAATARAAAPTATAVAPAAATAAAVAPVAAAAAIVAVVAPTGAGLVERGQVGAGVAGGHDLALVDPALDADAAERRAGLVEAVVDVGAQRVQRHPTVVVHLGPRHLGAAEPAGDLDLAALGTRAHGARERALHRAPEGDAVDELLGDRLGDELRVELRPLDLEDVDLDRLAGQAVQVAPQRVHLRARLADHDARARGVDVHLDLGRVLADRDVGQAGVRQLVRDVVADGHVLDQEVREVALVEPVRLPVVDVPHAHGFGMYLLPHALELLRGERDRQVRGPLADARGAAHGAWPVALQRRPLVGIHGGDTQVLAHQLVVVLRVGDRRLEQLGPVLGGGARREGEDGARLRDVLAADVVADQPRLARGGAHVLRVRGDGDAGLDGAAPVALACARGRSPLAAGGRRPGGLVGWLRLRIGLGRAVRGLPRARLAGGPCLASLVTGLGRLDRFVGGQLGLFGGDLGGTRLARARLPRRSRGCLRRFRGLRRGRGRLVGGLLGLHRRVDVDVGAGVDRRLGAGGGLDRLLGGGSGERGLLVGPLDLVACARRRSRSGIRLLLAHRTLPDFSWPR